MSCNEFYTIVSDVRIRLPHVAEPERSKASGSSHTSAMLMTKNCDRATKICCELAAFGSGSELNENQLSESECTLESESSREGNNITATLPNAACPAEAAAAFAAADVGHHHHICKDMKTNI